MEKQILLVEDEAALRTTLSDLLGAEGYQVEMTGDGEDGHRMAADGTFDLIVLDIMLPGKNGFDVCRDLRQQGVDTPILMLTARGETVEKVLGLKIGADDYLTKPFETLELLARVEALLRRPRQRASGSAAGAQFGNVRVDFRRTEVIRDEQIIPLSAMEYRLLHYFLEHRGDTLSREELLTEVWGYDAAMTSRTVDTHINWLRQKLEDDPKQPEWIVTVHGLGYKFTD